MPEAVGSSSASPGALRQQGTQAGFPLWGGPLFHRGPIKTGLAVLLAGLLAALPLLAGPADALASRAGRSQPAGHKAGFGAAEAAEAADPALREELARIAGEFTASVTAKTLARFGNKAGKRRLDLLAAPSRQYRDQLRADALARLRNAGADLAVSQFFVYADRNPATQLVFLAFFDAAGQTVRLLGADFISSGKLRAGDDSFITPVGVFENLPENWGYRAEGTKNAKGWRGLGAKGSRVWDFGFQQAPRQFRQGVYDSQMRLLMHATDPDQGEPRLGCPDSKGCVRVSAAANAFFDRHSILDRHYEEIASAEKDREMWLLRTDREPVAHPGSYLVVGDSSITSASR
ncbi:hypothetical protein DFW101_1282 [Solidesulfovibrio carbinoliphilus subsp. oakridgensis]|uniref:Uncharacterized protein n=1 Tax=Solidesulfovibrio carbinoliphilus subsp. oakridgensis TaxID=694327 RepID=G7Q6B9_9BACT|nr:hypothetical protein DFW101_1282 [Solidesulfovibrio carbinoliphilus subsp. oakridgensis]